MHNIDMSNSRANMAYVGTTPWHGLGVSMPANASLDDWIMQAGFDWQILEAVVKYQAAEGLCVKFEGRNVLYRSDTLAPLNITSDRYQVVQPMEVMEFFRDLCNDQGLTMETAGMLRGGAMYWALCRTDLNGTINGDVHNGYVLLATSCDSTMATIAKLTSVRVVCNNTLDVAMRGTGGKAVKTRHNTTFDAERVKKQLGLIDFEESWDNFRETMRELQDKHINATQATEFFSELLAPQRAKERQNLNATDFDQLLGVSAAVRDHKIKTDKARAIRGLADLESCYYNAPGAVPGNAYGLVQGVTRFIDHERGKDTDKRLASAWFGQGETLKTKAVEMAKAL